MPCLFVPRRPCFYYKDIFCQVSTLEEEIEELRIKFEASKNSRSSKSDNFGLQDEGRGSRCIFSSACQDLDVPRNIIG